MTSGDRELLEAVQRVRAAEVRRDVAVGDYDRARATLVRVMRERGRDTDVIEHDGKATKIQIIAAERAKIDADGLRKAIGVRRFNKIASVKVDSDKLKKALQDGALDGEVVGRFVTITKSAAWPKITDAEDAEE